MRKPQIYRHLCPADGRNTRGQRLLFRRRKCLRAFRLQQEPGSDVPLRRCRCRHGVPRPVCSGRRRRRNRPDLDLVFRNAPDCVELGKTMSAFEHVILLLSFVYALALTHLLLSIAGMIRAASRVRFSIIFAFWMANAFMVIIGDWISFYDLRALPRF